MAKHGRMARFGAYGGGWWWERRHVGGGGRPLPRALLCVLVLAFAVGLGSAQAAAGPNPTDAPEVVTTSADGSEPASADGSSEGGSSQDEASPDRTSRDGTPPDATPQVGVSIVEAGPPPAIGAFGVTAGFPSYQTVALSFSVQAQYIGLQVKGSLTPAGPYFGFQARGYPPVPFPVPVFVGVGAGFYGPNTTLFAVVGAHVPLSLAVRLDVEGGVAQVPLLDRRQIVPYVSVGVSYAFPLPAAPPAGQVTALDRVRGDGDGGPVVACLEPGEPDRSSLAAAVKRTVREFLESARATYGSIYTDLRYDYEISDTKVSGELGTVEIRYSGSVRTIATGGRESAKGTATARYRWNGCSWRGAGVDY